MGMGVAAWAASLSRATSNKISLSYLLYFIAMDQSSCQEKYCRGHPNRMARKNKIIELASRPTEILDENCKILIRKAGSESKEWSLQELEASYEGTPEWRKIKEGGVLSVPVEEPRLRRRPEPGRSGRVTFPEHKDGRGNKIDNYTPAETVEKLWEPVRDRHDEEKRKSIASGFTEEEAEVNATREAEKVPQYKALSEWLDTEGEIELKRSLARMMERLGAPTLIIRSFDLKKMNKRLSELGITLPADTLKKHAEIDVLMGFVSGDNLYLVVCEVKRRRTYPWSGKVEPPKNAKISEAEKQLSMDLDILHVLLSGIPPSQIKFNMLAVFAGSLKAQLQSIFCDDCLQQGVICQEDLNDLSLLKKKTKVPDKLDPATANGKRHLLRFAARCLSHQSLLHIGYRTIEDQDHLVTERHKHNIETIEGKLKRSEYIVASDQQQKAIARFTAYSSQRHLVLTGPAGTGKTVVALQVANNLVRELEEDAEPGEGPVLVVTADDLEKESPLLKHLDVKTSSAKTKIFDNWQKIKKDHGVSQSAEKEKLKDFSFALLQKYKGQSVVILMDEIFLPERMLYSLAEPSECFPANVTIIAVVNPIRSSYLPTLPDSVLHINLTTPYRSTIAITSLARFLAKRMGYYVVPYEGKCGSDVDGKKPIVFDVGADKDNLKIALQRSREQFGDNATLIYDYEFHSFMREIRESHRTKKGEPWKCYYTGDFYGWEAEKVVAVGIGGPVSLEEATRAKTELILIIAESEKKEYKEYYQKIRVIIEAA